ncbi:unnamed protein product [Spirodela intermedia]|uniref:TFIIS N-terminal domain-containing protein n=1 Tax=Spirodela intermedia TaxID=51605 RepID=A0A7I8JYV1_SPIIN|nr:unnamed protein product [Spirodela intermedia]
MADFGELDYWRKHFRSADSDIFIVIEHAILIAASDYPAEFRNRRDQITERLFSCQLPRCFGCDRIKEQAFEVEGEEFSGGTGVLATGCGEKESKVNCGTDERQEDEDLKWVSSNYSFDEAEALTEEIEEENQIIGEVLRIKEIIVNKDYESDSRLFESLRRLQLMALSVEVLKATEIGKALNGLRRHSSRQISQLVSSLIGAWKILVDEWMDATAALTEGTPESKAPSVVEDEEEEGGLPSPPMDEGALFTTPGAMELSQFFDGMSDDGCAQKDDGSGKRAEDRMKKPSAQNQKRSMRKHQPSNKQEESPQEPVAERCRPQAEVPLAQRKLSSSSVASGPGRPQKACVAKVNGSFQKRQGSSGTGKKTSSSSHNLHEEIPVCAKLEAAKRKLHEGYQQAENAKKQRTIQVMELHDLPKRGLSRRQPFIKQGSRSQHRTNLCR